MVYILVAEDYGGCCSSGAKEFHGITGSKEVALKYVLECTKTNSALWYDDPKTESSTLLLHPEHVIDTNALPLLTAELENIRLHGEAKDVANVERYRDDLRRQEEQRIRNERVAAEKARRRENHIVLIDLRGEYDIIPPRGNNALHEILPKHRRAILRLLHDHASGEKNDAYVGPFSIVLDGNRYEITWNFTAEGGIWCPCDACYTRRRRALKKENTRTPLGLLWTYDEPVENFGRF